MQHGDGDETAPGTKFADTQTPERFLVFFNELREHDGAVPDRAREPAVRAGVSRVVEARLFKSERDDARGAIAVVGVEAHGDSRSDPRGHLVLVRKLESLFVRFRLPLPRPPLEKQARARPVEHATRFLFFFFIGVVGFSRANARRRVRRLERIRHAQLIAFVPGPAPAVWVVWVVGVV